MAIWSISYSQRDPAISFAVCLCWKSANFAICIVEYWIELGTETFNSYGKYSKSFATITEDSNREYKKSIWNLL